MADQGSSPHARGAPSKPTNTYHTVGLIPACAGSTRPAAAPAQVAGAHPRMRGEHSLSRVFDPPMPGSSPHARGAPCTTPVR